MFFHSLFILRKKTKSHLFFSASFLYWSSSWYFFSLILFNLVFFFLWQVFITLSWLFFYSFFVLFIILSSFFFRIFFSCFLQDFLPIKPGIIHFYILTRQLIRKIFFCQFITLISFFISILISHFSFTILLYHILLNYLIFLNFHF